MTSCRIDWISGVFASLAALCQAAPPPLHEQIDELIESHEGFQVPAAVAADSTFLRRVHLDLVGTIPTSHQVQAFAADSSADKRSRVIDELLDSPSHAWRMQYVMDELLMERRKAEHVSKEDWQEYLRSSFQENKPWDVLVRELLVADGVLEPRPAARFLLDRQLNSEEVTRDLGRIFLGRDLQCAQCHDHPDVDAYLQRHFYGLVAFIKRSYLFKDKQNGTVSIGEKAEGGDVEFTSVFTEVTDRTSPRMLDQSPIQDPPAEKQHYKVKPSKHARSLPVYSRRAQLALAMTDSENLAFRRNIANRMWALMMGQGLVEPLDMLHAANPATHPELLDLLANALLQHRYDLRYLMRQLALTKTYQRDSRLADVTAAAHERYLVGLLKPLSPEQLAWAMAQATGINSLSADRDTAGAEYSEQVAEFAKVFGAGGQSTRFEPSAGQALFLRNSELIQTWIANGSLAARLEPLGNQELAEELYLSVLSRPAAPPERERIARFLCSQTNRTAAVRTLIWAAMTSAEFRFNH